MDFFIKVIKETKEKYLNKLNENNIIINDLDNEIKELSKQPDFFKKLIERYKQEKYGYMVDNLRIYAIIEDLELLEKRGVDL